MQLPSFARSYDEFEKRGFELAGTSVDPPGRNATMVEKLGLPFPLLSDPRGELIERLGLWNEEEGVSEPAIVVLDKSGIVRYLYSGGKDFSDPPLEESLLEILDGASADGEPDGGEPEVQVPAEEAENATVRPDRPVNARAARALSPGYLLLDGRDKEEARGLGPRGPRGLRLPAPRRRVPERDRGDRVVGLSPVARGPRARRRR
jgi:AhpC/TSA family protein